MTIYKQWDMTFVLLHKATNFKLKSLSSNRAVYFVSCLSERKSVNKSRLGEL